MNDLNKDLPTGIIEADLAYPKEEDRIGYGEERTALGLDDVYEITLHHTKAFGWVIATLGIRRANARQRSAGRADRTYAIGLTDGKTYRVGLGPHVTKTIKVIPSKANAERLKPIIAKLTQGEENANTIRDRISTRRAQGQLHRAAGKTSWMW